MKWKKWNGHEWSKPWRGKPKERTLFFITVLLMEMLGVVFNSDINKGFFKKEKIITPIIEKEAEFFAPQPSIGIWTFFLGIAIIILVVLIAEGKIDFKKIGKRFKKFKKGFIKNLKLIQKKIDKIKGIDVRNLRKIKPHKKVKKVYHHKIRPFVYDEVEKTKELFIKEYKEHFSDKFIALLLIVVILGISFLAIIPEINNNLFVGEEVEVVGIKILKPEKELYSPPQLFSPLVFILGLAIIITVANMKLKRDLKK